MILGTYLSKGASVKAHNFPQLLAFHGLNINVLLKNFLRARFQFIGNQLQ